MDYVREPLFDIRGYVVEFSINDDRTVWRVSSFMEDCPDATYEEAAAFIKEHTSSVMPYRLRRI